MKMTKLTLSRKCLDDILQVNEALCNDVPEKHNPKRQRRILCGTMKGYFNKFANTDEESLRRINNPNEQRVKYT